MRGLLIQSLPAVLDPQRRYRLDPRVAMRPERFGALAYHYGNRRLNFVRSPLLVEVLQHLDEHPTLQHALDSRVPGPHHPAFVRALTALVASDFLQTDDSPAPSGAGPDPEVPGDAPTHR